MINDDFFENITTLSFKVNFSITFGIEILFYIYFTKNRIIIMKNLLNIKLFGILFLMNILVIIFDLKLSWLIIT